MWEMIEEYAHITSGDNAVLQARITDETTAEKLFADIKAAGIEAVMPPAHECKEEQ